MRSDLEVTWAQELFSATSVPLAKGVELLTDQDFNNWATLNSIEVLARIKYGNFLDNFDGVPVGIAPLGELADIISLEEQGIKLLRPKQLSEIELPDASMDMVYSNFTFEHLQNPRAVAVEIARLLKPGAITAHFIDIEDHSDFANPFNYLIYSDEEWEAVMGMEKRRNGHTKIDAVHPIFVGSSPQAG